MAGEINFSCALTYFKSTVMSAPVSRSTPDGVFSVNGTHYVEGTMLVGTSATLIPLGSVTQPHWAWLFNKDPNNAIRIRNGAGGADLVKLLAGESSPVPLLETAVPYAIADSAGCLMEYLIISL